LIKRSTRLWVCRKRVSLLKIGQNCFGLSSPLILRDKDNSLVPSPPASIIPHRFAGDSAPANRTAARICNPEILQEVDNLIRPSSSVTEFSVKVPTKTGRRQVPWDNLRPTEANAQRFRFCAGRLPVTTTPGDRFREWFFDPVHTFQAGQTG